MNVRGTRVEGEEVLGDQSSTPCARCHWLGPIEIREEDFGYDLMAEPTEQMDGLDVVEVGKTYQGCQLDLCFDQ